MNHWLRHEQGMEQVLSKIVMEQFITALPHVLRIWVASHSLVTPPAVAELIESYDSAHSTLGNKVRTRQLDYNPNGSLVRVPRSPQNGKKGRMKDC